MFQNISRNQKYSYTNTLLNQFHGYHNIDFTILLDNLIHTVPNFNQIIDDGYEFISIQKLFESPVSFCSSVKHLSSIQNNNPKLPLKKNLLIGQLFCHHCSLTYIGDKTGNIPVLCIHNHVKYLDNIVLFFHWSLIRVHVFQKTIHYLEVDCADALVLFEIRKQPPLPIYIEKDISQNNHSNFHIQGRLVAKSPLFHSNKSKKRPKYPKDNVDCFCKTKNFSFQVCFLKFSNPSFNKDLYILLKGGRSIQWYPFLEIGQNYYISNLKVVRSFNNIDFELDPDHSVFFPLSYDLFDSSLNNTQYINNNDTINYQGIITKQINEYVFQCDHLYLLYLTNYSCYDFHQHCPFAFRIGAQIKLFNAHPLFTGNSPSGLGCCAFSHLSIESFSPCSVFDDYSRVTHQLLSLTKHLNLSDTSYYYECLFQLKKKFGRHFSLSSLIGKEILSNQFSFSPSSFSEPSNTYGSLTHLISSFLTLNFFRNQLKEFLFHDTCCNIVQYNQYYPPLLPLKKLKNRSSIHNIIHHYQQKHIHSFPKTWTYHRITLKEFLLVKINWSTYFHSLIIYDDTASIPVVFFGYKQFHQLNILYLKKCYLIIETSNKKSDNGYLYYIIVSANDCKFFLNNDIEQKSSPLLFNPSSSFVPTAIIIIDSPKPIFLQHEKPNYQVKGKGVNLHCNVLILEPITLNLNESSYLYYPLMNVGSLFFFFDSFDPSNIININSNSIKSISLEDLLQYLKEIHHPICDYDLTKYFSWPETPKISLISDILTCIYPYSSPDSLVTVIGLIISKEFRQQTDSSQSLEICLVIRELEMPHFITIYIAYPFQETLFSLIPGAVVIFRKLCRQFYKLKISLVATQYSSFEIQSYNPSSQIESLIPSHSLSFSLLSYYSISFPLYLQQTILKFRGKISRIEKMEIRWKCPPSSTNLQNVNTDLQQTPYIMAELNIFDGSSNAVFICMDDILWKILGPQTQRYLENLSFENGYFEYPSKDTYPELDDIFFKLITQPPLIFYCQQYFPPFLADQVENHEIQYLEYEYILNKQTHQTFIRPLAMFKVLEFEHMSIFQEIYRISHNIKKHQNSDTIISR